MSAAFVLLAVHKASAMAASALPGINAIHMENEYADVNAQIGGKYAVQTDLNSDYTFEVSPKTAAQIASADLMWKQTTRRSMPAPDSSFMNREPHTPAVLPDTIVYVVDDDEPTRIALSALFRSVGLRVETFGSAREFLSFVKPAIPSCIVLDVRLPHQNGLELQQQLLNSESRTSIVFISGHGDIAMTVRAMKAGAHDFIAKPFRDQDILDAVTSALRHDTERLRKERSMIDLRGRYDSMNAKERAVMGYVVAGLMNKQIAAEMSLSEITIKTYRATAMKKMASRTLAAFVRTAEILGIDPNRQFISKYGAPNEQAHE